MVFLVADDHELVRKGLVAILAARADITIHEAGNGQEAVQKALDLRPDFVILDVTMPHLDGLAASRQIHAALPGVPILILSIHEGREIARAAKDSGAKGFVTKRDAGSVLLQAVDALLQGKTFYSYGQE
jgi:DNA-binding NarL/FixJ family response regulator